MTESYDHTGEAGLPGRPSGADHCRGSGSSLDLPGFEGAGSWGWILGVNLVTQLALNVGLNWTAYQDGTGQIFLRYALMELGVFAAEAVLYVRLLPVSGQDRGQAPPPGWWATRRRPTCSPWWLAGRWPVSCRVSFED